MSDFLFGAESGNGRIMIVDDEPDVRKLVRLALTKGGFHVIEAEDGAKAIETLNTGENRLMLDVIICDIRMPKINGMEAIAYFRKEYPRVPLIVLTGFPDTEMAMSLIRQGVADYLVKPVESDKLRAAVARAMELRHIHAL
jgi:two-component system chemotaxis response regulator CheY